VQRFVTQWMLEDGVRGTINVASTQACRFDNPVKRTAILKNNGKLEALGVLAPLTLPIEQQELSAQSAGRQLNYLQDKFQRSTKDPITILHSETMTLAKKETGGIVEQLITEDQLQRMALAHPRLRPSNDVGTALKAGPVCITDVIAQQQTEQNAGFAVVGLYTSDAWVLAPCETSGKRKRCSHGCVDNTVTHSTCDGRHGVCSDEECVQRLRGHLKQEASKVRG